MFYQNIVVVCVLACSVVQSLNSDEKQCFLPLRQLLATNITESRTQVEIMETTLEAHVSVKIHNGVSQTTDILNKVTEYVNSKLKFRAVKCIRLVSNLKPMRRHYRNQVIDCINITSIPTFELLTSSSSKLDSLKSKLTEVLYKLCKSTDQLCSLIAELEELLAQLRCLVTETLPKLISDTDSLLPIALDSCVTNAVDGVSASVAEIISDIERCVNPDKPVVFKVISKLLNDVLGE